MREYEYVGVLLTMFAYVMIVTGNYQLGFIVGLAGNCALFVFAYSNKILGILGLQVFFACANIYALIN